MQVIAHSHAADVFAEHKCRFLDPSQATGGEFSEAAAGMIAEEYNPDLILTGVFGPIEGGLDFWLIRYAQQQHIASYGVLDAWMNYAMRLADAASGNPIAYFPDRMAVMDADTVAELASIGVPAHRLDVTGHPFLPVVRQHDRAAANRMRESFGVFGDEKLIVFFSEPLRWGTEQGLSDSLGYDEFIAFDLLQGAIQRVDRPDLLVVKEHPRHASLILPERIGKTRVVRSDTPAVLNLIAAADVVAGMSTTLLVYAYLLGKQVLAIQPGVHPLGDCNVLTRRCLVPNLDTIDALTKALSSTTPDAGSQLAGTREQMNWHGEPDIQVAKCVHRLAIQASALRTGSADQTSVAVSLLDS